MLGVMASKSCSTHFWESAAVLVKDDECIISVRTDHAVCVAQNFVGLLVVDIANVVERNEELKWVFRVDFSNSTLNLLLDFVLPLLPVTSKPKKLALICPQNGLILLRAHAGENMMNCNRLASAPHHPGTCKRPSLRYTMASLE